MSILTELKGGRIPCGPRAIPKPLTNLPADVLSVGFRIHLWETHAVLRFADRLEEWLVSECDGEGNWQLAQWERTEFFQKPIR